MSDMAPQATEGPPQEDATAASDNSSAAEDVYPMEKIKHPGMNGEWFRVCVCVRERESERERERFAS